MGEIGCYTLDLYCDHPEHRAYFSEAWPSPTQYIGRNYTACVRKARKDGWTVNRRAAWREGQNGSGRCLCPLHSKRAAAVRPPGDGSGATTTPKGE